MTGSMYRLKRWWRDLFHPLAHRLGYNEGTVTTWYEDDAESDYKRLMVGFRCLTCGEINGAHETYISKCVREGLRERKLRYRDL